MNRLTSWARRAKTAAIVAGIVVTTLVITDLVCNLFGLFPPKQEFGDPDVGWLAARRASTVRYDGCLQMSGTAVRFLRNEDGVRTSLSVNEILADHQKFKIGDTGDSQTDLCAPNSETHAGVLQQELDAHGANAMVLPYGVGRYSPLQDYLVFKKVLKHYGLDALIVNFYTGNDFNDLLRVDDRPHFVESNGEYEIAPPEWYRYQDPRTPLRSRVLYVLRSLAEATGIRDLVLRFRFLYHIASEQGAGLPAVVGYMNALRNSRDPALAYPDALAAQFLSQQIFFHWFPASRAESIRRLRALMALARHENPGMLLIASAIPSYELVQQHPVDEALLSTLKGLSITYDGGVSEEHALYDSVRAVAGEEGWLFVDNLTPLQQYRGPDRLYNGYDYHLLPAASAIIGRAQAAVLLAYLQGHRKPAHPPRHAS